MKCAVCGEELSPNSRLCTGCKTKYIHACTICAKEAAVTAATCPDCGGAVDLIWNPSVEELTALGIHCFIPYTDDRIYDIYLGGNRDGGGYVFHNTVGYTGPIKETIVLPSMVNGRPIYGIWNEFFCTGDALFPDAYNKTFERLYPIKHIVVSDGIKEAGIYAFTGCFGLETLTLPKSMIKMHYDFYELFKNGLSLLPNGETRKPVSIHYKGSKEEWERVALPSLFNDFVGKGYIKLVYKHKD
jgi:hypothetical protein